MQLIDTHCHLDMKEFEEDLDRVIERAITEGVTRMLTVGIDYESSCRAVGLGQRYEVAFAAVGCHPHHASKGKAEEIERLTELASAPGVVAWGEIGLDYHYRHATPEEQSACFSLQLERADDLDLPVIIHDREAHEETLRMLKKMGKGERKGVIHCFSGDRDLAAAFVDLGYYISIPGTVTYKNASMVRETVSSLPIEHLLVETDAPFLSPMPMRGRRNEPAFLVHTTREIALLRGMDPEEIARQTSENAEILFRFSIKA